MHYHSPQHGMPGLRVAALPPHGETNLPSTSTLPEPSNQPQNPSAIAPASGPLERMQAEVQAVLQQAQVTQQSLKKLQARESVGPYNAIVSDLSGGLSSVDSTILGVGSGLVLTTAIVWWYVWHRLRIRWMGATPAASAEEQPISTRAPLFARNGSLHAPSSTQPPRIALHEDDLAWDPSTVSGDTAQPHESGHGPFARHGPNREFDPEVAASEVSRVRKSLAEKREARAQLQDREDSVSAAIDLDLDLDVDDIAAATPSVRAWLNSEITSKAFPEPMATSPTSDLDLDLDLDAWQPPPPPQPQTPPQEPAPAAEESISFSLAEDDTALVEPEPTQAPDPEQPADDGPLELELALNEKSAPEPPPEPQVEPESESDLALEAEPLSEPEPELQLALAPESTPMPDMEYEFGLTPAPQASGSKGYDFTITLALAQESATLELWNEARDLASEVLESDDPNQVSEALSLLERLNQMELEAPVDMPPGNGAR